MKPFGQWTTSQFRAKSVSLFRRLRAFLASSVRELPWKSAFASLTELARNADYHILRQNSI